MLLGLSAYARRRADDAKQRSRTGLGMQVRAHLGFMLTRALVDDVIARCFSQKKGLANELDGLAADYSSESNVGAGGAAGDGGELGVHSVDRLLGVQKLQSKARRRRRSGEEEGGEHRCMTPGHK